MTLTKLLKNYPLQTSSFNRKKTCRYDGNFPITRSDSVNFTAKLNEYDHSFCENKRKSLYETFTLSNSSMEFERNKYIQSWQRHTFNWTKFSFVWHSSIINESYTRANTVAYKSGLKCKVEVCSWWFPSVAIACGNKLEG